MTESNRSHQATPDEEPVNSGLTVDQIANTHAVAESVVISAIHDGRLVPIARDGAGPVAIPFDQVDKWARDNGPAQIYSSLTGVPEHDGDERVALLAALPHLARRLLDGDYAALTLINPTGHITRMVVSGMSGNQAAAIGHPPIGKGLLGSLDGDSAPLRVADIPNNSKSVGFPPGHPDMRSLIGVGVGRLAGRDDRARIYVTRSSGREPFTAEDQELLEAIAAFAAQALELDRLRRSETELRIRAEEAEKAKSEFLSMINHDLRNPISSMRFGLLEAEAAGSIADHQIYEVLTSSLDQVSSLVSSLLDMAQLGRTTPNLDLEEAYPIEILGEAAARQRRGHLSENRIIKVEASSSLPVVLCDVIQIGRVFDNLVSNALKYSDGDVLLSATHNPDTASVTMSVSDEGSGIPAEDVERIFEPFERLPKSGRTIEGLGLGLAICKKIVDAHGGQINYRRTESSGSVFTVDIPTG